MIKGYNKLLWLVVAPCFLMAARAIDFDTQIHWRSSVIDEALNRAGLYSEYTSNIAKEVSDTYNRVFYALLNMDTFSVRDATRICLDKCNMSDFLKNGRGESGRKCPEICKDFANNLVAVNNELNIDHASNGLEKQWSEDKKYYILWEGGTSRKLAKYANICTSSDLDYDGMLYKWDGEHYYQVGVVFEANTNKPIALLGSPYGDDGNVTRVHCTIGAYDYFEFYCYGDIFSVKDMKSEYNQGYQEAYRNLKECSVSLDTVENNLASLYPYIERSKFGDITRYKQNIQSLISKYTTTPVSAEFTKDFVDDAKSWCMYANMTVEDFDSAKKCVSYVKSLNNKTVDWSYEQTGTPEDAYEMVLHAVLEKMPYSRRTSCQQYLNFTEQFKCSGKCNPLPGTDDTVTCTYKDITVKYVFDDICDRAERKYNEKFEKEHAEFLESLKKKGL